MEASEKMKCNSSRDSNTIGMIVLLLRRKLLFFFNLLGGYYGSPEYLGSLQKPSPLHQASLGSSKMLCKKIPVFFMKLEVGFFPVEAV